MLDSLENYYIYKITKQGEQINDLSTNKNNPIYEFLNKHIKYLNLKHYTHTNPSPSITSPPFLTSNIPYSRPSPIPYAITYKAPSVHQTEHTASEDYTVKKVNKNEQKHK
jgi:hypothetical protein